tara:strand:- start:512 stop:811 length:300 start_codon:yes stop_codon:yes gene_type:complete
VNKEQVRKTITPLNADYFLDNYEKSDGKDFRNDLEKQLMDGESYHFPVVGNRTGFIQWNYVTSKFSAFSLPTNTLNTVLKTNLGKEYDSNKKLHLCECH